jgi:hypothetical protein
MSAFLSRPLRDGLLVIGGMVIGLLLRSAWHWWGREGALAVVLALWCVWLLPFLIRRCSTLLTGGE